MLENDKDKKIQELEAQNEKFRLELENRDGQNIRNSKWRFWIARKAGGIFLGWRLKNSIRSLFSELKTGKVRSETLSDVSTHVLWRFTRIGLFAVFAALIPIAFLAIQTYILSKQNEKLDFQNKRIEQQTFLQEAERRSSLVFLFNNVLDKIDDELKEQKGITDTLSNPLIGRIISLSQALKPYRYLDGDTITTKAVSPERGQLLVSLIESNLDTTTYDKIYSKAVFSGSELREVNLSKAYLTGANLRGAILKEANLNRADLRGTNLTEADLTKAILIKTDLTVANLTRAQLPEANLFWADLKGADLTEANLTQANLEKANLFWAYLTEAELIGVNLRETDLLGADLTGAVIDDPEWITNLTLNRGIGSSQFDSIYLIDSLVYPWETDYILKLKK